MSEANHTQLILDPDCDPFAGSENNQPCAHIWGKRKDNTSTIVAQIWSNMDDAKDIVKAYNNHDALVSALQSMTLANSRDVDDYPDDGLYDIVMNAIKKAEEALADATK